MRRSLRQLKREVADRLAAKQTLAPAGYDEEEFGDDNDEQQFVIGTVSVAACKGASLLGQKRNGTEV